MRTSQFESVPTIFCRVLYGGSFKKKIKTLPFAFAEIFTKMYNFFRKISTSKTCFAFFSKRDFDGVSPTSGPNGTR